LEHDLTETQIKLCPALAIYEHGQQLTIKIGDKVRCCAPNGSIRLTLERDGDGNIKEAIDPLGRAVLRVRFYGFGSAGTDPIQDGWFIFELSPAHSELMKDVL
jgi:hypothetical protein